MVGGDDPERLGGELLAELARQRAELAQLARDPAVVAWGWRSRRRRRSSGRQRRAGPPRRRRSSRSLRERATWRAPTWGAKGLMLTTTMSIAPIPWAASSSSWAGIVAAGQDPGIDRWVEGLDLAADERRDVGQLGDRADLDAVLGEVLAGAVRGEDLDVQRLELSREGADPIATRHREQGSHPGFLPHSVRGSRGLPRSATVRARRGRGGVVSRRAAPHLRPSIASRRGILGTLPDRLARPAHRVRHRRISTR